MAFYKFTKPVVKISSEWSQLAEFVFELTNRYQQRPEVIDQRLHAVLHRQGSIEVEEHEAIVLYLVRGN